MWILTPPWLLFSLRGWRKRCQHDPGSRLWRGSGGKSKTLSISSPHTGVMLSQTFLIAFPVKISHVQRQAHRWFLFMEVYCLSRGNKYDRMLLRSSKSKCLISLPVKIGSLMLWLTYPDQSNCILNAVIICCFTTMLFISFVFITRQTVYNKLWKDHLRSAETSCSMSSVPSVLCVWQEGKQAALAADFSVTQFKHLGRLLMVHGRNSYKRSAALSQFVIHRSLCISAMQVQHNTKSVFVSSWKFVRHSFYCNRTKLQILTTKMFFRPDIFAYHQRAMVFIVTGIFTFCYISNMNNLFHSPFETSVYI